MIEGLGELRNLEKINFTSNKNLKLIGDLSSLGHLKYLILTDCKELQEI